MRRAVRLFRLVQVMRARRFVTGEELADELAVSKRTIYRDMADLQASGVPVRGEAGVGYRLERGYELPPLTFTSAELESLVLGARMVATWGDPELAAAVGGAMTKVEAVLPDALRRVVLETHLYAPGHMRRGAVTQELATLRRAVGERRKLRLGYEREDGERSERVVRPLGLYFWGKTWTLAAWCELRADYRSFRPDRMAAVELLDDAFDDSDGVSLAEFLKRVEVRDAERGEWCPPAAS